MKRIATARMFQPTLPGMDSDRQAMRRIAKDVLPDSAYRTGWTGAEVPPTESDAPPWEEIPVIDYSI